MAVKYRDYYEILGVARNATQDQVQRAYRKLARQYHPDINKTGEADARFKEINEAHEVLKDPDKRKRYDALGADWKNGQEFTPPPDWGGGQFHTGRTPNGRGFQFRTTGDAGAFSEFFESMFGPGGPFAGNAHQVGGFEEMFGRAGQARRSPAMPQDQEARLTIPLADAYHGAKRELTLRGTNGSTHTVRVKIPAGVTDGSTIRLRGLAEGADLLLHISVAPDPHFELAGSDLVTDLPLTPWEASLGAKLDVPTFAGSVTLTVPPASQSGQKLRVRGKGMPKRGGEHGDLFVRLKIAIPKTPSDEERRLFEKLREVSRFNPRRS